MTGDPPWTKYPEGDPRAEPWNYVLGQYCPLGPHPVVDTTYTDQYGTVRYAHSNLPTEHNPKF